MEFWIDVGGTFTDCLVRLPDGTLSAHKLLSTGAYQGVAASGSGGNLLVDPARCADPPGYFAGWRCNGIEVRRFDPATGRIELNGPAPAAGAGYLLQGPEEAPLAGVRWLLGLRLDQPIGGVSIRLGTTRGTNALLERTGAPCALVATRGMGDCLEIGDQHRPRLFDLHVKKPEALHRRTVELDERLDAEGCVLRPLDPAAVREALLPLLDEGIDALAVCLLHAHRNAAHEQIVERIARELGFAHVVCSSRIAPYEGLAARAATAVLEAYLAPVLGDYTDVLRRGAPEARLQLMSSAGALVDAAAFRATHSILSGPAGGVVGCAAAARAAGCTHAIGFDMGGTSTDVSRWAGRYERRYEMALADPRTGGELLLVAPMLAIETVAAGGGSICGYDGIGPTVGPQSAGADPGPACYGRGGPLTLTDVNLVLGRLSPDALPFPLDLGASLRALDALRAAVGRYSREELARGLVRIADAKMAAAIRRISIARGYDVRDHVLVAFGGAGGQHACGVAAELGIGRVLCHPLAGVLSAWGIGQAVLRRFGGWHVGAPLGVDLEEGFSCLEAELADELVAQGVPRDGVDPARRLLDLRYAGQSGTLSIERPAGGDWARAFEAAHRRRFGFAFPGRAIEVQSARVERSGGARRPIEPPRDEPPPRALQPGTRRREALAPGDAFDGPSIVLEGTATIVVEPGWRARVLAGGELLLEAVAPRRPPAVSTEADPIQLELFNRRFAAIAEEMGEALRRSAISVNVKERLDYSCAIFDPQGGLVVNAPHIPVHLGAMSATVRRLVADVPDLRPGDVYLTNDPYRGGSHLPDVTAITPVFLGGAAPVFFTASRAHHAEIGGTRPGSMPPDSRRLSEEGVLIECLRLVRDDASAEAELRRLLERGPHPSRAVEHNLADVAAQVAANQAGAARLLALVRDCGLDVVQAYMGHIQQAAAEKMGRALLRLPAGRRSFTDRLDDGTPLQVSIEITHDPPHAVIDFAGTGGPHPGNLNAPPAIVSAAVLYCFRCLIGEELPLNAGVLVPLEIRLPPESLLDPPPGAAVAGGNVETSQRVVDCILGALGVVAASQGTMNNLIFGDESFGYYETIGGGSGAGPGFPGAHAVHTHMTNTRLTDPEVLESRCPVRLVRCGVRRGSGGAGRFPGGDGIVRELEFTAPLELSLLTQRRLTAPYGLEGGSPGAPGHNRLLRASGRIEELPPIAAASVRPGDVLVIETPGGGGYGAA